MSQMTGWSSVEASPAHLLIQTQGGVPLLIRTYGNCEPFSFPMVGTINSIFTFVNQQDYNLASLEDGHFQAIYNSYNENNVIMCLVTSKADSMNPVRARFLLDLVWYSIVLCIGGDELRQAVGVDRLKQDIRACQPIIDSVFNDRLYLGPSILNVDAIQCPEAASLVPLLTQYATKCDSDFACILFHGRLCAATDRWWELSTIELVCLNTLVHSLQFAAVRDIPIFLPIASPNVAHRLVTVAPIPDVDIVFILGGGNSLSTVQKELATFWDAAKAFAQIPLCVLPHNSTVHLAVDPGIVGFLAVDCIKPRTWYTTRPRNELSVEYIHGILIDCYDMIAGDMFKSIGNSFHRTEVKTVSEPAPAQLSSGNDTPVLSRQSSNASSAASSVDSLEVDASANLSYSSLASSSTQPHIVQESYMVLPSFKFYALRSRKVELYILFEAAVPQQALTKISRDLLARVEG